MTASTWRQELATWCRRRSHLVFLLTTTCSGTPIRVPVQRYLRWFAAPSRVERLEAAFSHDNYSWGPGQVARYRDQDFFVLAAAMDALVKERDGTETALWPLIEQNVFRPIGLTHAVVNRTVEPDGSPGIPLLGGGLFLTLEEVACIAALYQALGEHAGEQLLHRASVNEATDPHIAKGLPTGLYNADGQLHYHMGFWHRPYRTRIGKLLHLPTMFGYGGTEIVLLPNAMTAIRFGHDDPRGRHNLRCYSAGACRRATLTVLTRPCIG